MQAGVSHMKNKLVMLNTFLKTIVEKNGLLWTLVDWKHSDIDSKVKIWMKMKIDKVPKLTSLFEREGENWGFISLSS
jgi:hypothetical protein